MEYSERVKELAERGYEVIQNGVIFGGIEFHCVSAEADLGMVLEIYRIPPGFRFRPPDEWYPGPPPGAP
jgi:hypothetical protein